MLAFGRLPQRLTLGSRLSTLALLYVAGDVIARAAQLAVWPIWMRHLDVAEFGVIDLMRTFTVLLVAVVSVGLHAAVPRFAAVLPRDDFRQFFATAVLAQAGFCAALLVLGALVGPTIFAALAPGLPFAPLGWLVVITAAIVAIGQPAQSLVIFRGKARLHGLVTISGAIVLVTVGTWAVNSGRGAAGVLEGFAFAAAVVSLGYLGATIREASWRPRPDQAVEMLAFGAPLVAHLLAQHVLLSADRQLILWWGGGAEAVGRYGTAYLFASAVTVAMMAMNKATYPKLYAMLGADQETSQEELALTTVWLVIIGGIALAGAAWGPLVAVAMLPPSYADAASLIPLVVWGAALHGAYLPFVNVLFHAKRSRWIAAVSIGCAAGNIALNVALIPSHGPAGAAAATLVSYLCLAGLVALRARRERGWRGLHLLSAGWVLLLAGLLSCIAVVSAGNSPVRLAILGTLALIAYAGLTVRTTRQSARRVAAWHTIDSR